ncbi:MAG: protein kinase [Gemmatimonadota bacterium]|jgi:serine/threonine-protein kinase
MSDPVTRLNSALEGRYRVERELGEGGMARVFLADDLKHNRKVAVKVLKPELAAVMGGERFLAEIETTANLQHPHILPLFDSGEADGFLFYVMPYIDGESLRDRLDREKQLPVDEAVRITKDVAEALHAAHDEGVVHRDIKPANILLSRGRPLVTDFGIALAVSAAGGGRLTETGLSLGTPYYMSPEQASADREVSARSDIYSLACVLYEMLAGDPPHPGSSAQAVLVRILTEEARPLADVRKSVPSNVRSAVEKALEKLPADRFESAEAFARALGDPAFRYRQRQPSGTSGAAGAADGWGGGWGRWKLVGVAAIPALVVGAALGWGMRRGDPAFDRDAPVIRMAFDSAMGVQNAGYVDISNGGSTLAYTGPGGIHIVELDGPRQRILPGTEDAAGVVFSPDGSELVVFMDPGLYRVPVGGGPPILLLERPLSVPGEWAPDGTLYFAGLDGLYRLPPEGEPERIVEEGFPETVRMTEVPGGRWLLYSRRAAGGSDPGELRILDLESLESRTLLPGGFDPHYATTGHVVYMRNDQSVLAAGFDAEAGEVVGRPFAVLDSLALTGFGIGPLALSRTGSLFYVRGPRLGSGHDGRFARVSSEGVLDVLPIPEADLGLPALSPGGERLAFTRGSDVVVYDLGTGAETTLPAGITAGVTWSDDGERIVYTGFGGGRGAGVHIGIWRWRDGPTAREVPIDRPGIFFTTDFTPDGRVIGFLSASGNTSTQSDILIADTAGTLTPYLNASWSESSPRISPDGDWVAYTSDESGTREVYVRAYPTPGERYDVSAGPGSSPFWARDGNLYFARGDSLWLAELTLSPEPTVRSRRPVLGREQAEGQLNVYNVTAGPDGDLIAEITPAENEEADADAGPEQPRVAWIVANWFTELLERAGGGDP